MNFVSDNISASSGKYIISYKVLPGGKTFCYNLFIKDLYLLEEVITNTIDTFELPWSTGYDIQKCPIYVEVWKYFKMIVKLMTINIYDAFKI